MSQEGLYFINFNVVFHQRNKKKNTNYLLS